MRRGVLVITALRTKLPALPTPVWFVVTGVARAAGYQPAGATFVVGVLAMAYEGALVTSVGTAIAALELGVAAIARVANLTVLFVAWKRASARDAAAQRTR